MVEWFTGLTSIRQLEVQFLCFTYVLRFVPVQEYYINRQRYQEMAPVYCMGLDLVQIYELRVNQIKPT